MTNAMVLLDNWVLRCAISLSIAMFLLNKINGMCEKVSGMVEDEMGLGI